MVGSAARVQGIKRENRCEEVAVVNTNCSFKSLVVKGKRELGGISFQRVKQIIYKLNNSLKNFFIEV